jgi:hypothetical protein
MTRLSETPRSVTHDFHAKPPTISTQNRSARRSQYAAALSFLCLEVRDVEGRICDGGHRVFAARCVWE